MLATAKPSRKESAASCRVREAVFDDYPKIADLQSRYGLVPKPFDEWIHLWKANPAYFPLRDWSIGWVVETHAREIVGYIANIPTNVEFKGRRLLAASGGGLVVDERYRSYAFPLFSQFFNQTRVDLILNTSVNANGLNLHTLFHCQRVPSGAWNQSEFWITDYPNFTERMLAQKNLPRILRYPVAAALVLKDTFHRSPRGTLANGLILETCSSFDHRFDDFWTTKRTSSTRLLSVRASETLQWHFQFALQQGKAWIVTVGDSLRLIAYAIFLRQDNAEVALKRMRLVDFQCIDGNPEHLIPIVSAALQKCRNQKVHMLEAIGFSPEKQQVLARIASHHRELPCWLYFYKAKDKQLAEDLKNPSAWDPSSFDGDSSL